MTVLLYSIIGVVDIVSRSFNSLACVSIETHNVQRVFGRILDTNRGSLCQEFLTETVETGTKNRCVNEATHV